MDVNKVNTAYGYVSDYTSIGIQLSLGLDLVVSGFLADNICIEDGVAIGKSATFDVGAGGGLVIWHSETGDFVGFSVPVGVSSGGGGYARIRAETDVLLATCGEQVRPDPVIIPTPGPTPEPAPPPRYLVVSGDSLWSIAANAYDDGSAYPIVYAANEDSISDPNLIYPGQLLVLPDAP